MFASKISMLCNSLYNNILHNNNSIDIAKYCFDARCEFCATPETQQHINAACAHPPPVEKQRHQRRRIDKFLKCCKHHQLD
jgi:hypothetical protein